jgi:hypothetical protein
MLLAIVALMLLGSVALGAQLPALAQEATPAGVDEEGLTYEPVAFALGVELPSPADLFVARIGIEPGAGFEIDESDPSTGMCLVEEGTITIRADAPMTVTRGATLGEAMMAAEESGDMSGAFEAIPAGEEVTLEVGDAGNIPASVNGEIRNDGDEPAVCLAIVAGPSMGMMAEATPEP